MKVDKINLKKEEKLVNNIKEEIKIEERIEYGYKVIPISDNKLNKEVEEFTVSEVKFDICIENDKDWSWPGQGKTRLIYDKENSELLYEDIELKNLNKNQNQRLIIPFELENMKPGINKCIFHFNVEGINYGEPLVLTVKIKENEQIDNFRAAFELSESDFDNKQLFEALKKHNFNHNDAFSSLFDN